MFLVLIITTAVHTDILEYNIEKHVYFFFFRDNDAFAHVQQKEIGEND